MKCEMCGVEIKVSGAWGVATGSKARVTSHYFCSEQHGNIWIEEHPEYKKLWGTVVDETDTT